MRQTTVTASFNRGRVSPLAAGRVEDIKRISLSAEIMTNFSARTLGPMMLRVGTQYLGSTRGDDLAVHVPFIYSVDDTAILELTDSFIRVYVDDELISRPAVTSAVTNGTFDANLGSWNDADEAGAASAWATGGYMSLVGTGTNAAIRTQQVTVSAPDQNVEHALRITVNRGPVQLRVGSTSGADDYITETTLGTGAHSLAFTPTGASFWIHLSNRRIAASLVDSVTVEGSGVMSLPSSWDEDDLPFVYWKNLQSADVIFVACRGQQQRKIERRATRSWSIALYEPEDGPFRVENTGPITVTPSAITGDITLASSAALFRSGHVGALWRITSEGQRVESDIAADNTFTNEIRVTGVGESRRFTVTLAGTWTATVTLQRSIGEVGNWEDVTTYTANQDTTYADGLDNQIIFYRVGVKTGDYTSDTVEAALSYPLGSITGVVKITAFTNSQSVSARVLKDLGDTDPTDIWAEGLWSTYRGWPSAGCLYEGRLDWFGKDKAICSISDAFDQFDPDFEGDAGPINRNIGGAADVVAWALPLQRLVIGTGSAEVSCRSSALDEPLTPTNFNPKDATTQGSALVAAEKIDSRGVFVQRGGVRLYELLFDGGVDINDYSARDLTLLCPEFGEPGIAQLAVQRQPDTRIHCRRTDGTVGIAIVDKAENVLCLLDWETDGVVEDIVVLPRSIEDAVYYTVRRAVDGSTVRYFEKWALESECRGATLNKQVDSFVVYSGSATRNISGLDHLEGCEVAVWADGTDRSPGNPDEDDGQTLYTVAGGEITVTEGDPFTSAVVGLPYTAQWMNAKTALATATGSSLTSPKNMDSLGLLLQNTHSKGLKYGPSFDKLDPMPDIESGKLVGYDTIHETYDEPAFEFDGEWKSDSRLCLQARSPRSCTVLAAVATVSA